MSQALPPYTFHHPTRRVVFGAGRLTELADIVEEFGLRRPAVIIDPYFAGGGLQQRLASLFEVAVGAPGAYHVGPAREPDIADIQVCRDFLAAETADLVIAVGGGSIMDCAKVARIWLSNPGDLKAIAGSVGARFKPHASLLVCVPTTAGTGSEVSESAIVGLPKASESKLIFRGAPVAADIAILDPDLSISAPAQVTAASGFGAVAHAVEAFTSNMSGPLTDPLAGSAMQLLAGALEYAVNDPDDLTARSMSLIGSMQAAMAFNSADLGLARAIAEALGALYHVPHGIANAMALPWSMAYSQAELGQKGNAIAAIFGGGTTAAAAMSKLRATIGLDVSLDSFVVGADKLDRAAEAAMRSRQIGTNPRAPTQAEIRAILEHMREPTNGDQPLLISR